MSKITKKIEIIIFFFIIPIILIPINSNIIIFGTLSLVAFFCFIYLNYKKIYLFNKNEFKFDQSLKQIFYKTFVIAILILLFSYIFDKEKFLDLPKSNFLLWLIILILYPIFSAFPQEIIYRKFFFQRYRKLFKNKKVFIIANAFLFSFAHIIYLNPIVINLYFHRRFIDGNLIFTTSIAIQGFCGAWTLWKYSFFFRPWKLFLSHARFKFWLT